MGMGPSAREARAWGMMGYVLAFGAFANFTFLSTGSPLMDGHSFLACLGAVVAIALLAVRHAMVRLLSATSLVLIAASLGWTLTAEVQTVQNEMLVMDLLTLWKPTLVFALVVVAARRGGRAEAAIGTVVGVVLAATILGLTVFSQIEIARGGDLAGLDATAAMSTLACELLLLFVAGWCWWRGPDAGGWSSAREAALLIWAHIGLTVVPMALLFVRTPLDSGLAALQASYPVRALLFVVLVVAGTHLIRAGVHLGRAYAGWIAGVLLVAGSAVSLGMLMMGTDPLRITFDAESVPLLLTLGALHLGTVFALLNWMRAMATTAGDPTTESFANVALGGVLLGFVASPMVAIGPTGMVTYGAYLLLLAAVVMVAWGRLLLHADRQVRAGRRMARSEIKRASTNLGGLHTG